MTKNTRLGRLTALHLAALGTLAVPAVMAAESAVMQEKKAGEIHFTLLTGDKVSAVVKNDGALAGIRLLGADGNDVITSIFKVGDDTYVVPPQAQQLIDAKAVDLELFNISKLYQSGYDDESTDKLPVIVEYRDGTLAGPAMPFAVAGTTLTSELEIIDSAAFGIDKAQAAQVWHSLTADSRVEAVWLDAVIHAHKTDAAAMLTPTVPLTGAYGKYAAPYNGFGVTVAVLDTGYDVEHADLHGQVIAAKDFTNSRNGVDDMNGHGTHTASTVAGNGANSDGLWVGMAPGAQLVIGKVLSNSGGGSTSQILNGMQWAVLSQQADIVNMSLGGTATSCSGPLVDMVEQLSDKALFVISAGNSFTRETIGSPGCAASALTVGALDRDNQTATFSSRGPSPDGHSAKPDIASQGVAVVAAASGGSGKETGYRSLSGTSMSAPHVAGGAALLKQARPDLTPRELKKVLTSSVTPTAEHVLEQGAGPMDVNRAIMQTVVAAPNMELGRFNNQQQDAYTETFVVMENLSDSDKSFKLKLSLIGEDGKTQLPATLAGLGVKSVTVPARSTAEIPVWIDPAVAVRSGAYGAITGRIEGTDTANSDERFTVPVSFWIAQPTVQLSFSLTDLHGSPASPPSKIYIMNDEDDWGKYLSVTNGSASAVVPKGEYSIVANIMTYDAPNAVTGLVESAAQMAVLRKKVDRDTNINFDARVAEKLEFKTDKPLSTQGFSFGFTYALDDAKSAKLAAIELAPDYVKDVYLWSQGHDDRFRSFVSTRAFAPEAVITSQSGMVLDFIKQSLALSFHGAGSAEVVAVGDANYGTDWSQFDLAGKIALIGNPNFLTSYMVANAMNNGAIGVIFYRPGKQGRSKGTIFGTPRIPVIGISSEQGELLLDEIESGNNVVSWSGTAAERTPYAYSIHHITDGRIDGGVVRLHDAEMHKITASYHSQGEERTAWTDVMALTNGSGEFYSTGSPQLVMLPVVRDEYYTATSKNAWTNIVMPNSRLGSDGGFFDGPHLMTAGAEEQTSWFKAPKGGSLLTNGSAVAYRDTNTINMSFAALGDAAGHDGIGGSNGSSGYGLTVNGVATFLDSGMLTMPDESAEVRLQVRYVARGVADRSPVKDKLGSFYNGYYTFMTDSEAQGAQPVLIPAIDVPTDIHNSVAAGQPIEIKLAGRMDAVEHVSLANVTLQYGFGQECLLNDGIFASTYCPVSEKFSPEAWQNAEVKLVNGEWIAVIPATGKAGDFVHLRVLMSDYGSSTAEQVTMRAFMLK